MVEFIKCIVMIMLFLMIFVAFGYLGSKLIKWKSSCMEKLVLGFFIYFALFQAFALPLILWKQTLSKLLVIWLTVVTSILVSAFIVLYKEVRKQDKLKVLLPGKQVVCCYLVMAVVVLFFCYFTAIQNYWGWDTAFYIGTISTTVDSNTMYLINGENGLPETTLSLRYALSSFYMNSAVFCKLTGIGVVGFQKYVMGTIDVLLYFSMVYLVGKTLFGKTLEKRTGFLVLVGILNLFFVSEYTTSQFLLLRAYEAKSYCANVVLPSVFWLLLLIHKDWTNKGYWRALFIVMLASVPVSMSAILIAPAMLGVGVLAESVVNKNRKILVRGILCMIPNVVYLAIYLLYTLEVFVIRV